MKPTRRKLILRLVVLIGLIYGATLAFQYFISSQQAVYVKWTFPAGGRFGQPLIQPDGSLIVGAMDGKVYKLSSEGQEIWSCDTGAQIRSGVTKGKNVIYVQNLSSDLLAIDHQEHFCGKPPLTK